MFTHHRMTIAVALSVFIVAAFGTIGIKVWTNGGSSDVTHLEMSAYPALVTPEQAVQMDQMTVVGTVRRISAGRWSTADGKKPANFDKVGLADGQYNFVYRTAYIEVREQLSGPKREFPGLLPVTVWGGTADGVSLAVYEIPPGEVSIGDELVLFLMPPEAPVRENWLALLSFRTKDGKAANEHIGEMDLAVLRDRVRNEAARLGKLP